MSPTEELWLRAIIVIDINPLFVCDVNTLSRATKGKVTPNEKNNEGKQGREPESKTKNSLNLYLTLVPQDNLSGLVFSNHIICTVVFMVTIFQTISLV